VTDGVDSVLVPPGEPTRLADALVALAQDPAQRAALAHAATKRADALDANAAVREIEAVYREAVGR
jgi:glycosyltransferase involved in cell wall biosynthesis